MSVVSQNVVWCAAVPPDLLDKVLETGAVRCRHCRSVSTLGGLTKEEWNEAEKQLAQMSPTDAAQQVWSQCSATVVCPMRKDSFSDMWLELQESPALQAEQQEQAAARSKGRGDRGRKRGRGSAGRGGR